MNYLNRNLRNLATFAVAVAIGFAVANVNGQEAAAKEKSKDKRSDFCSGNSWSDDKVSFKELREMTVAATGSISVDALRNGGISVIGGDRGDIMLRSCIQTWGDTAESAKSTAAGVRINTSGTIKAENLGDEHRGSVSYQLLVPRSTNLKLEAHNGGISISNVDGRVEFETQNGGVSLKNLSGDVKGRTTNGGVSVVLAGNSWKGSGLDVETNNGGVDVTMSKDYSARIETGTVNGGFRSDIPGLEPEKDDDRGRRRSSRITKDLNGGGAPVKVVTTNGGIRINAPDNE